MSHTHHHQFHHAALRWKGVPTTKMIRLLPLLCAALLQAQSPWDGYWQLDAARSSPNAREGAAADYRFHILRDGSLTWEIPSLREVVNGRTDGKPMPIRRPGAPKDLSLSVQRVNDQVLHYQVHLRGVLQGEGRMTLVEDGKAWVDITWPAGKPEHAAVVVYVKRESH